MYVVSLIDWTSGKQILTKLCLVESHICYFEKVTTVLDQGNIIDIIYLDFK